MSGVLPAWIERLLGIESSSGQGVVWSLDIAWSWAPWVTLLFVAATLVWITFLYARDGANLGRGVKILLVSLRMGALALLLVMLSEVMISLQRTGLPYVVIVVDESASMSIADRYGDEKLRTALAQRLKRAGLDEPTRINLAKLLLLEDDAHLLSAIERKYKLKVYFLAGAAAVQVGDMAELKAEIRRLDAKGDVSRLGAGLRTVLGDLRGTPPAAVILLTDGVTTDGETLAESAAFARRKGVPLLAVGLGSEELVRDVELADLLVDEVVFVDDVVSFQATVAATGYDGQTAEVTLREKDGRKVLARATATLRNGEPNKVRLTYRPTQVGKFEYVVEVAPLSEEAQAENNRRSKIVSVLKEQIRVLLVQSYPNYEFRYLKHMLQRDSTIELKTVLQEADLEYAQFDATALQVFPVRKEDLFQFDVILFGDVNPAFLSPSAMELLREFVVEKGGGLAVISGPQYTPLAYRDTPLAALLPIELGAATAPAPDEIAQDGFSPRPTELGTASPNMQLGDDAVETAELWRKLAPLYWMIDAPAVKPAARVLAEHPTRTASDGRKLPIFLTQYVGAGKVLFHATDETWRWRYRVGDVLFARYWVQSIRYLARSKLLGSDRSAEVVVDRQQYRRGEPVRVRARFVDERLAPVPDDGVTVVVDRQGERSHNLKLNRAGNQRGIFEGVLTGVKEGNYHLWMVTPAMEGNAPAADFQVLAPPGEFEQVEMDVAELSRAATESRGKFYRIETAARLADDLPPGRQIPFETLPPEVLWNRWWLLSGFLGLLVTEWVVRKRNGLL